MNSPKRSADRPNIGSGHTTRPMLKRLVVCLFLSTLAAVLSSANARADAGVQLFVSVEGSPPDWQSLALTATKLDAAGQDASTRRRYATAAFDGSHPLTVLRAAEGLPRFLVGGPLPPGRVDDLTLTLGAAALTTASPVEGGRPREIPDAVENWIVKLQYLRPLNLADGEVASFVVRLRFGDEVVLTPDGALVFKPVLKAERMSDPPGPDNFLDDDETVIVGLTERFPALGIELVRGKIYDPDGAVRDLTLQTNTGALADFVEVRGRNEEAWRSDHGALGPSLVAALGALPGSELVLADVWLRVPGAATFETAATTPEAWDVEHAAFVAARRAAAQPIADAVSAALVAGGATILGVELSPPVLHIRMSRTGLETVAAHLSDVIEIVETPAEGAILNTNGAKDLVQDPLWLAHVLLAGQGLRAAVVEPQACINTGHEAFRNVTIETPVGFPCTSTQGNAGHSTAVASALAAAVGPPGSIELVGLFQGRMLTSDICAITDALLQRNPHLINLSCEVEGDISRRQLDHAVFVDRIFVANGAGNVESGEDPATLRTFGESYNSVCVGGYQHAGTIGPGNFGDDIAVNRYLNDARTHREKPDLVGPNNGRFARYEGTDQYDSWGGTSFATPFIVGTAGLLMANFQSKLVNDPTLTRAVLMASAFHPIPTSGHPPVPSYSDGIDDRAGAGAPRGDRARRILLDDQFYSAFIDRNANFNSSGNLTTPLEFIVQAGEKVRVVMTYDQCQDAFTATPDVLLADMDLIAVASSLEPGQPGSKVFTNNSHVDNTEILEFTADVRSVVSLRIHVQHWDPCADGTRKTYLAVAWDALSPGAAAAAAARPDETLLNGIRELNAGAAPQRLAFRSVAPNPTAGDLTLSFDLPRAGTVQIRVYDLAGRLVAQPFAGAHEAGSWTTAWNGVGADGRRVPPGMYLVRLRLDEESVTTRIIVTK